MIYLTFSVACNVQAQAVSVTVSTDQPIYPIWHLGGRVTVTAQNLKSSVTYYLWTQRPGQMLSNFTGLTLLQGSGEPSASIALNITSRDPAGTYLLSLSMSGTTDTREAVAHFGVMGTDKRAYERTGIVVLAGGGFAPNSTIALLISSSDVAYPGFPLNLTAQRSGEFEYHFKISSSARIGSTNAIVTGTTYDKHQAETTKSSFTVSPTAITTQAVNAPTPRVERTIQVSSTYRLSYKDGSPVTSANATAYVMLAAKMEYMVPLVLVNSTLGEWNASWSPPPSANNATYYFQFNPANFTDNYGNRGQGSTITSSDFEVIAATLQTTMHAVQVMQRTQNSVLTISAIYPSGASVANVTQATIAVTTSSGTKIKLTPSLTGAQATAPLKIPVNAALGNWTVNYNVRDLSGNSGSGIFIFHVQPANLTFEPQTPNATQRTTFLILNNTVRYPDGTTLNSTVMLQIHGGNRTWIPKLNFDSATGTWSGSLYIVQNATLGRYGVIWVANDPYGNARTSNYTTFIVPARFTFLVERNNTAVPPMSNLDLPVLVRYPNDSSLTNDVGNVTGSYENSTGYIFTVPLVYNSTNATWHMFFIVPEQANATLSFNAIDRFGNSAVAMDAYNLKITPVPKTVTENLIIAGILGALIPIGLLIWAFATISTRRRKHRP